jgi:hypothetical protein
MRQGEAVFVDSGAWIALALSRDPLHSQAREQWELLLSRALSDPYYDSRANTRDKVAFLCALLRKNAPDVPMAAGGEVLGFELGRTAEVRNNPGARGWAATDDGPLRTASTPGGNLPFEPSMRRAEDPMIAIIGSTTHSCGAPLGRTKPKCSIISIGSNFVFRLLVMQAHRLTNAFVYGVSGGTRALSN